MGEEQDDPPGAGRPEERPEEKLIELEDPSLEEPPPPGPDPEDGFDPVDSHEPDAEPVLDAEVTADGDVPAGEPVETDAPGPERSAHLEAARAFEQRARLAEDRLAEVLDGYRKLKAESEGHRTRISRNLERRFEQRHEALLLKFIEILDNLDRALDAAEQTFAGEALIQGLILVRTQLLQTLKDDGLERIPVLGLPFDPHVSEVLGTEPVDAEEQEGLVVKELLRGYRLHGRVARAARVLVGHFPHEEGESPEADAAPDAERPPEPEDDRS